MTEPVTVDARPPIAVKGVHFAVLGPLEARRSATDLDLGGPKQAAVLALLLANRSEGVSTDALVQGIWGDDASPAAKASLYTYISNLRAILGGLIERRTSHYQLHGDWTLDAALFEDAIERARTTISTDPAGCASSLREALEMWRGLPYANLVDVPGLQSEIRRLEELRLAAVELRIDADLAAGHHEALVGELEALAEEHRTRERFRAQQMLALYRSGRQTEALRAYRRTEAYLSLELGLEPSRELQELELAILDHDPDLELGVGRATTQRLAFLVTDIEGSTATWDRHPQAMAEALLTHDRILREAVEEHQGRIFKHTGDGVLAVFSDAVLAARGAEAAQREFSSTEWGEVDQLKVRMGIDVGEVESRGDDFFGAPVNRATRLMSAGYGGQVLISASVQAELARQAPSGVQIRQLGDHRLRGFAAPERIAQLVFVGLPADFPELRLEVDPNVGAEPRALSLPGYELREKIGEGTLGVVWRAYQPSVGREVAIKVIRPELASHPEFVRGFEAEARTIARLAHPHIVPLIDFWRDAAGAYLVLQLLPAGSLEELMEIGAVDWNLASRILRQVGEALDHAHSQDVVHGDLQPANILIDGANNAYLSDFGIAARLIDPEVAASLSRSPDFRAPEERMTGPSEAADIFALGILAGRLMGGAPQIEAALRRSTAPNPTDRYSSAAQFLADLEEAMGDTAPEPLLLADIRNPYKGLRAFDESDASDFYGRDELVATLVSAVDNHRLVTVVGPSGSGKSSAVRAGLLPSLARGALKGSEDWLWASFLPGSFPADSLLQALESVALEDAALADDIERGDLTSAAEKVLSDSPSELVLVIDQFEELFTLVDDAERRQAFIDLLTAAVEGETARVRVVATLRADFYHRPLEDEHLGRLVSNGLVTVLPPSGDELVEMISQPAMAVGLRWEPGLPHRIAQDVARQPGALPLLQYALTELVERRGGDLLSADDYQRIGGVGGALATKAEHLFEELTPAQRAAARQVLLRLVMVDEGSEAARRRVRRVELESLALDREDLDEILALFTARRLLLGDRDPVTRGPTVEVAHEALLTRWPRLRNWVEEERESLVLERRLRGALEDWVEADHDPDYLLTGSRLAPYLDWDRSASLTADERSFLDASRQRDEEKQAAKTRRRRLISGILAGAALIAVVLAALALLQSRRATEEAELARAAEHQAELAAQRADRNAELAELESVRADRNAQVARSRELAASAISVLNEDPRLSKLLALSAADIADPPIEAVSALHEAFLNDPVVEMYEWPEGREMGVLWTDIDPSGQFLVASGSPPGSEAGGPSNYEGSTYMEMGDLSTNEAIWSFETSPGTAIASSFFSSDGDAVIAGVMANPGSKPAPSSQLGIHVLDASTGELLTHMDVGLCGGIVIDVSPTHLLTIPMPASNGTCVADQGLEYTIEAIDLRTDESRVITINPAGAVAYHDSVGVSARMSGDGRYVAIGEYVFDDSSAVYSIVVTDLTTGSQVAAFDLDVSLTVFRQLQDMNEDGSAMLVGGNPLQMIDTFTGDVLMEFDTSIGDFSPTFGVDDSLIYANGQNAVLALWDSTTGEELMTFPAVGSGRISTSSHGQVLVADLSTKTAVLVDPSRRGEVGTFPAEPCFPPTGGVKTTVELIVTYQICPMAAITTVASIDGGEVLYSIPGAQGQSFTISPDGTRFVRQDGGLREDGPFTDSLVIRSLDKGEALLELDGICQANINLENSPDQEGCNPFPETPFPFWAQQVRWSPDGEVIAAVNGPGLDPVLVVWDAATGDLLHARSRAVTPAVTDILFTPDGQSLLSTVRQVDGRASLEQIMVGSWEVSTIAELEPSLDGIARLGLVGFSADNTLIGLGGWLGQAGGALHWIDAETLEVVKSRGPIHDGTVRMGLLSPDGTKIVTAGTEGLVRVWSSASGELLHQIPMETQVQSIVFTDDTHLVVGTIEGDLLEMTIDKDELLGIVADSLTRGFTETECQKFNFEHCPTLDELRLVGSGE